jgi:hypothetical protein
VSYLMRFQKSFGRVRTRSLGLVNCLAAGQRRRPGKDNVAAMQETVVKIGGKESEGVIKFSSARHAIVVVRRRHMGESELK